MSNCKTQNKEQPTLKLFHNSTVIFTSTKKWLYPLFDLESFLKDYLTHHPEATSDLYLEDKIVGKASAFLIVYMGIPKVHAHILSSYGKKVFETYSIQYTYDTLIERVSCKTEELLKNVRAPKEAYRIIQNLRNNNT